MQPKQGILIPVTDRGDTQHLLQPLAPPSLSLEQRSPNLKLCLRFAEY
jgi:hypothetical protein